MKQTLITIMGYPCCLLQEEITFIILNPLTCHKILSNSLNACETRLWHYTIIVFTTKQVKKKNLEHSFDICLVFVDDKTAVDSVNRRILRMTIAMLDGLREIRCVSFHHCCESKRSKCNNKNIEKVFNEVKSDIKKCMSTHPFLDVHTATHVILKRMQCFMTYFLTYKYWLNIIIYYII